MSHLPFDTQDTCNLRQNIIGKLTVVRKLSFSIEFLKLNFDKFLVRQSKFDFRVTGWVLTHNFKYFSDL